MSKRVVDQAEGLRRLLAPPSTHVVAVAGMSRGEGTTTVAMGLAAALAVQGREVLVLDEHAPRAGSAAVLARGDGAVDVKPAKGELLSHDFDPRSWSPGGVVVIDAALDDEGRLSATAEAADDLLLVLQPRAASITAAYAGVKRLHYAHGLQQARFLVNAAPDERGALQIMANLSAAGSRYLAVSLSPAGWLHADPRLEDARRLGRTVVEAFPASPAALDLRRVASALLHWPRQSPAPRAVAAA
ncbi:flagellar biosynthesis protein FlhG [Variovorax dokdonensis]|uniref:Flagellar biosynthesis protein FlhG n=1 Tax=Variovorax dokdonensis TaxID=344883 RepID=A0ABT7N4W7_9BURK|nr:flagellar biosynthesis protein FlhG [Variovorax dokdonensis]MDM0042989.1 flagellar biosynthesis protein FlhG [Variovorax dokdonensis]